MRLHDRIQGLILLTLDEIRFKWAGVVFRYHFYCLMFYIQRHLPQLLVNQHYRTNWVPKLFYVLAHMYHGVGAVSDFSEQMVIIQDTTDFVGRMDHWHVMISSDNVAEFSHRMEQISKEVLQYLKLNKFRHTLWLL